MTDIDHIIAVMQAAKEGKAIQRRHHYLQDADVHWEDTPKPVWNWTSFDYRVKPAEPRKVWLNVYPTMNCRSSVCYDSREEAANCARHDITEQVEFVEVVK